MVGRAHAAVPLFCCQRAADPCGVGAQGAVTVQAVWRGVLARREYRHRRACRQAAKAYRRRRGQQALRAWRQVRRPTPGGLRAITTVFASF